VEYVAALPHKLWHQNYVIADVTAAFANMYFSDENKFLIKKCALVEGI